MNKFLYVFLFFISILFFPKFLFSEEVFSITDIEFKPKEFLIGEEVVCRVDLQVKEGVELFVPEKFAQDKWIDINSIKIDRKGQFYKVYINFTSFKMGNLFLPVVDLGGISLKNIALYIQPSFNYENSKIEEPKGQLYLPRTVTYSLILILFLAAVPVLIFSLSGKLSNIRVKFIEFFTRKRPFKIFTKECLYLKDNLDILESKVFYTKLIKAFRTYLTVSTKDDFFSVTTGEMEVLLLRHFDRESVKDILSIVKHSDEIRFSFKNENLRREEKDILKIMEVCSNFEKNIGTDNLNELNENLFEEKI